MLGESRNIKSQNGIVALEQDEHARETLKKEEYMSRPPECTRKVYLGEKLGTRMIRSKGHYLDTQKLKLTCPLKYFLLLK